MDSEGLGRLIDAINEQVVARVDHRPHSLTPRQLAELGPLDADRIAVDLGYRSIGDRWREQQPDVARAMVTHQIGHDLAYRFPDVRPLPECAEVADALFAVVGDPVRIFVNHTQDSPRDSGYAVAPIQIEWTFEQAWCLVGCGGAVLVCFLAED